MNLYEEYPWLEECNKRWDKTNAKYEEWEKNSQYKCTRAYRRLEGKTIQGWKDNFGTSPQCYIWRNGEIPKKRIESCALIHYPKYHQGITQVWTNNGENGGDYFDKRTPMDIEKFLQIVLEDNELKLCEIYLSDEFYHGYPIWVFGVS